jgi:hypothetical protein
MSSIERDTLAEVGIPCSMARSEQDVWHEVGLYPGGCASVKVEDEARDLAKSTLRAPRLPTSSGKAAAVLVLSVTI